MTLSFLLLVLFIVVYLLVSQSARHTNKEYRVSGLTLDKHC